MTQWHIANGAASVCQPKQEWEFAAKARKEAKYPWGNQDIEDQRPKANTWQGSFPSFNTVMGWIRQCSPRKIISGQCIWIVRHGRQCMGMVCGLVPA